MMRAPFKPGYLTSWSKFKTWATVSGEFEKKLLANTSLLQYWTFQFFAITVLLAMPVKLFLRLVFTIKYVWVTPFSMSEAVEGSSCRNRTNRLH
jgi:hypothetical protein